MNELMKKEDQELISVLQSSLYVGCKPESIGMVLDYCRAAKLDPMQKPVHIVPMNTKDPVTGEYAWRDVVMPGIGLYRIQADRSGTMAGISEPEFGPAITSDFTDRRGNTVSVTYPEWCKVTVKKLVGGNIVEFTAKELWLENYATDSGKSTAPNAMWRKRPFGQLAKCAEAQALRKGWPEIGSAPTAEEMEGKTIDHAPSERDITAEVEVVLCDYPGEKFDENLPAWRDAIASGRATPQRIIQMISAKHKLSAEQVSVIEALSRADEQTGDSGHDAEATR